MALKRTVDFIKRNPSTVAWVVAALFISGAFIQQDQAAKDRRRQICQTALEDRMVLRDLIDYSLARNPNPEAQEIVQQFYDRIELPPTICKGTGIDVEDFFRRSPTTSTTEAPSEQPQSQAPTEREGPVASSTSVPPVTVIVEIRPTGAPDRIDPPQETTTTTAPSTTTTSRFEIDIPPITLPLATEISARSWLAEAFLWSGWSRWD